MRLVEFSITYLVVLSLSGTVLAASPQTCDQYTKNAIQQLQQAQSLNIPTPFPTWSDNYQHHYNWCLGQNDNALAQGQAIRQAEIDKAKAASHSPATSTATMTSTDMANPVQMPQLPVGAVASQGGSNSACGRYAAESVRQNQMNKNLGAGFTGAAWSDDIQAHLKWCQQGNNLETTPGHLQNRAKMLQEFAINNGKDAARRYAEESVRQNEENKAMGAGYPPPSWSSDFNSHYHWSNSPANLATTPGHLAERARMLQEAAIKGKSAAAPAPVVGGVIPAPARNQLPGKNIPKDASAATESPTAFVLHPSQTAEGRVFIPLLMHYIERQLVGVGNPDVTDQGIAKLLQESPQTRDFYLRMLQKYKAIPYASKQQMFDPGIVQLTASPGNVVRQSDVDQAYQRVASHLAINRLVSQKNPSQPYAPTRLVSINSSGTSMEQQGGPGGYSQGIFLQWRWDRPDKPAGFAIYRRLPSETQSQFLTEVSANTLTFRDSSMPPATAQIDAYCYEVRAFNRPLVSVKWQSNRIESKPSDSACTNYGPNAQPLADTDGDGWADPFDWCPNDGQAKEKPRVNGCLDWDQDGWADEIKDPNIPGTLKDNCTEANAMADGYGQRGYEWDHLPPYEPLPGCQVKYQLRWMGLEIYNDPVDCTNPNNDRPGCDSETGLGNEHNTQNEVINKQQLPTGFEPYLVFGLMNGVSPQGMTQQWTKRWCCGEGVNVGNLLAKDLPPAVIQPSGIEPDSDFKGAESYEVDREVLTQGMILLPEDYKIYVTIDGLGLLLTSTLYERDFDMQYTPERSEVDMMKFLTGGAGAMQGLVGCATSGAIGCLSSLGDKVVSLITFGMTSNQNPDPVTVKDPDDTMGAQSTGFTASRAAEVTKNTGVYGFYQEIPYGSYYTSYVKGGLTKAPPLDMQTVATMVGRAKFCLVRKGVDETQIMQLCEPYAASEN